MVPLKSILSFSSPHSDIIGIHRFKNFNFFFFFSQQSRDPRKQLEYRKETQETTTTNMLTYDSRLERAARASSGEPIEMNARPLFLVLLCIESLTNTRK